MLGGKSESVFIRELPGTGMLANIMPRAAIVRVVRSWHLSATAVHGKAAQDLGNTTSKRQILGLTSKHGSCSKNSQVSRASPRTAEHTVGSSGFQAPDSVDDITSKIRVALSSQSHSNAYSRAS